MKKSTTVIIIALLAVLIAYLFNAHNKKFDPENIRKNILDTVVQMEQYPFVPFWYYPDLPNDRMAINQTRRSVWLYKNASNRELKELLRYPNNNIKVFAIYLLYRDEGDTNIFHHPDIVRILDEQFDMYDGSNFTYKTTIRKFIREDTLNGGMILKYLYERDTLADSELLTPENQYPN